MLLDCCLTHACTVLTSSDAHFIHSGAHALAQVVPKTKFHFSKIHHVHRSKQASARADALCGVFFCKVCVTDVVNSLCGSLPTRIVHVRIFFHFRPHCYLILHGLECFFGAEVLVVEPRISKNKSTHTPLKQYSLNEDSLTPHPFISPKLCAWLVSGVTIVEILTCRGVRQLFWDDRSMLVERTICPNRVKAM